jgi:hypothetical protein
VGVRARLSILVRSKNFWPIPEIISRFPGHLARSPVNTLTELNAYLNFPLIFTNSER